MEKTKKFYKHRLGLGLLKWMANNKAEMEKNKGAKLQLVKSLRGLESASGVSYRIIQGISKGERSPEYTTLEAIAEALNVKLSTFLEFCEKISEEEIFQVIEKTNSQKSKSKK
ncbi:helix-turn-helix domain-containing protein [Chitinophaga sp. Mgbs1]|uniref:Helix-turn-helix domain-containing protein n=1 Tax=Chitinophaga solisilvae TaxID=1233460 RepID=A0A9Q5D147_9BACT|nr:helix-turn-helix domain-containing protein [Chitinophaga solisilvae]